MNILVLAPHTDDGELGCGATLSKLMRQGNNVYYVVFSICEESVPKGYPSNILSTELQHAMKKLEVPMENVKVMNYRVRHFAESRQSILDQMIEVDKNINPELIFMPSINDIHQDHKVVAEEGLRAYKKKSILCYELPWNNFMYYNQAFSIVDEYDVEKKIEALRCYETQKERAYTQPEAIKAILLGHGLQCGHQFAEVFEIPRWIF